MFADVEGSSSPGSGDGSASDGSTSDGSDTEHSTGDDVATDTGHFRENGLENGVVAFGFEPAYAPGREYFRAFDGDPSSFFDYRHDGAVFLGLDFGSPVEPRQLKFQARSGWTARMIGGEFQGSNESATSGYVTIHRIEEEPTASEQVVDLSGSPAYRFFRYLAPEQSHGNIAEFSIVTENAGDPEPAVPTNPEIGVSDGYREAIVGGFRVFGFDPAYSEGQEFENAFDGKNHTFYDYGPNDSVFVGIDFGEPVSAAQVRIHPRFGYGDRMKGGMIQASNESSVSGYETLHTIDSSLSFEEHVFQIESADKYRFFRYVAREDAHGNIAEFAVDLASPDAPLQDPDRLPDEWEVEHFGSIDAANGGENKDFDGDGVNNYDEFLAGTNPADPNDLLSPTPVLGVAWNSKPDVTYAVQVSDDNWRNYDTVETLSGNGDRIIWIDPDQWEALAGRQYRVSVVSQ